jgi:uncharacterized protein (TIGR02646 family)
MRAITKGAEPPSLTAYRHTEDSNYNDYPDKDALRQSLVTEQRGLSCYCMSRIHNSYATMKIEHWRSQSGYPAEQLTYRNLLGACLGGHGQPPNLQHCDTRKADHDLEWNPAEPDHHIETRIRYEMDGSIRSHNQDFDAELDGVLNLNIAVLKNNRKGALDAVLAWWRKEKAVRRGAVSRTRFEQERNRRLNESGHLDPFSHVAVWWIEQRLNRMPV